MVEDKKKSLNDSIKVMSEYSMGLEKEILDEIINDDDDSQFKDENLKKLVHIQLNTNDDKR